MALWPVVYWRTLNRQAFLQDPARTLKESLSQETFCVAPFRVSIFSIGLRASWRIPGIAGLLQWIASRCPDIAAADRRIPINGGWRGSVPLPGVGETTQRVPSFSDDGGRVYRQKGDCILPPENSGRVFRREDTVDHLKRAHDTRIAH